MTVEEKKPFDKKAFLSRKDEPVVEKEKVIPIKESGKKPVFDKAAFLAKPSPQEQQAPSQPQQPEQSFGSAALETAQYFGDAVGAQAEAGLEGITQYVATGAKNTLADVLDFAGFKDAAEYMRSDLSAADAANKAVQETLAKSMPQLPSERSQGQMEDIAQVGEIKIPYIDMTVKEAARTPAAGIAGFAEIATAPPMDEKKFMETGVLDSSQKSRQGFEQATKTISDVQQGGYSDVAGERTLEETGSPEAAILAYMSGDIAGALTGKGALDVVAEKVPVVAQTAKQAIQTKLKDAMQEQALKRQAVREGRETSSTAGMVLEDRSQQRPIKTNVDGVEVEFKLGEINIEPAEISPVSGLPKVTEDAPPKIELPLMEDVEDLSTAVKETGVLDWMGIGKDGQPKIITLDTAKQAQHQGIENRTITRITQANKPTREIMKKMNIHHRQFVDGTVDTPADKYISKEFEQRLETVRETHRKAIETQARAINNDLAKKKGADFAPHRDSVYNSWFGVAEDGTPTGTLSKQGIKVDEKTGELDFSGVPPLQRKPLDEESISLAWEQYKQAKNGADLHKLRQGIDDTRKIAPPNLAQRPALSDEILSDMRNDLKRELEIMSESYADANKVISKNLATFERFYKAFPEMKDLNLNKMKDFNQAMDAFALNSRNIDNMTKSGIKINRVIDDFDTLAAQYGGKYDTNIRTLVKFHNDLKNRFGDGKGGSYQTLTESGTKRAGKALIGAGKELAKGNQGAAISETTKIRNKQLDIDDKKASKALNDLIDEVNAKQK